MTPPTVFLIGQDDVGTIPDFLRLGAVVVVAGDRETLERWRQDEAHWEPREGATRFASDVVVDLESRRILHAGVPIQVSELEFRVLGALAGRPGRAHSFAELRRAGWGDQVHVSGDVEGLRALIQRLRRKLEAARFPLRIEPVRGFGYRATVEAAQGDSVTT
jgi:DNA-binding response OmpR family regulator